MNKSQLVNNDFYKRFFDYCAEVVTVWENNEKSILQQYEATKKKDCFLTEMKKKTNDFSELKSFHTEFVKHLRGLKIFNKILKYQKDYDSKSFAEEIFGFQWFMPDGNRSGIEFPVFSDYVFSDSGISKPRLTGTEFLRVLRRFNDKCETKVFFSTYCKYIIEKWNNTDELNKKERNGKRESFNTLFKEIKKENFTNDDNRRTCIDIIEYYKEYKTEYEERKRKHHPMAELESILREEFIWQNNEEIRNTILAIRNGNNIIHAASLNEPQQPLRKNSEDKDNLTLADILSDEKYVHPLNDKYTKLDEIKQLISKYRNYVVMNCRNGMDNKKLNEIAQNLISLIFSGEYDLTTRKGITDIQSTLEKKYGKMDEWTVFLPNGNHGFGEKIKDRLDSFKNKITSEKVMTEIPPEDWTLLCKSIDGALRLLPQNEKK